MTSFGQVEGGHDHSEGKNTPPEPQPAAAAEVTVEDEARRIFRIRLRPGVQVTAEAGEKIRDSLIALTGGSDAAVLLQVTGVEAISREAVLVFSEARTVTAFAVLGSTSVDRVIAHWLHGLPLPQCPSRYFSDEQAALAWLRTLAERPDPDPPVT